MKWLYLSLIMIIAFLLRFIFLDKIPLGMFVDEALYGYNAYSIVETGKDETGTQFPIFFKVWGDYLSNGAIYYCVVPFIKLFGPTLFAMRLSMCFLGLITVFFTYKLVDLYFSKNIALLATLLIAISPWDIHVTRQAMDASALPPFFIMGLYLFAYGLKKNDKFIILSAIPVGLNFYCYAIARLFVSSFYLLFFILNIKKIIEKKNVVFIFLVIVSIMLLPFTKYSASELQNRFNFINITNEYYSLEPAKKELEKLNLDFISRNKPLLITATFLQNYFKHMSFDFLLINGDRNLRHHVGGRGQLLWFTFWMSIIGFLFIIFTRKPELYIFPIWLLIFPIPASLTWEGIPHANRAISGIPIFEILAAVGFTFLLSVSKKLFNSQSIKTQFLGLLLSVISVLAVVKGIDDFRSYLKRYFIDFPTYAGWWFNYDVYAISKATENMKEFDFFIMPVDFSDFNFLFLQKVDPKKWQQKSIKLKYVRTYPPPGIDVSGKKIARIVPPGQYKDEETIKYVYHEITGNLIYEIKRIKDIPTS